MLPLTSTAPRSTAPRPAGLYQVALPSRTVAATAPPDIAAPLPTRIPSPLPACATVGIHSVRTSSQDATRTTRPHGMQAAAAPSGGIRSYPSDLGTIPLE